MEKALILSLVVCFLFGIIKFLEMRYLEKKYKPLKEIVRDLFIVLIAAFSASFMFLYHQDRIDDFLAILTNTNIINKETTQVFTGSPDF